MAELVMVDRAVVQALNHAAQPQPLRLLVQLVATALAAGPALLLAVLAVQALRRRDPASLAIVVLTGLGAALALALNQLAGSEQGRRPAGGWPTGWPDSATATSPSGAQVNASPLLAVGSLFCVVQRVKIRLMNEMHSDHSMHHPSCTGGAVLGPGLRRGG